MRKSKFTAAAVIMGIAVTGLSITGCAGNTEPAESSVQETAETAEAEISETAEMMELQPAETTAHNEDDEAGESGAAKETTAEEPAVQAENSNGGYEDNFAVDSAAAAEFAGKIKDAVAAKDLNALADLTAFPVYVGLADAGTVETKEDFLALGADAVFTEELVNAIANADTENMQPSMAGFSLSDGGKANINFGVRDGVLAISGINY